MFVWSVAPHLPLVEFAVSVPAHLLALAVDGDRGVPGIAVLAGLREVPRPVVVALRSVCLPARRGRDAGAVLRRRDIVVVTTAVVAVVAAALEHEVEDFIATRPATDWLDDLATLVELLGEMLTTLPVEHRRCPDATGLVCLREDALPVTVTGGGRKGEESQRRDDDRDYTEELAHGASFLVPVNLNYYITYVFKSKG